MITTAVCVVRPPKEDIEVLSQGIGVLARATGTVFARVFQRGEREADVKRGLVTRESMLARHSSGCCCVDAQAAAHGGKEGLLDARNRPAQLEARREREWRKPAMRRRIAVATRKAETRLARVEKELQGRRRHCFGARELLRKGPLTEWCGRPDGTAPFAGETGRKFGNDVARRDAGRLQRKLPAGPGLVVREDVRFDAEVERDLQRCIAARTPVSLRVKLLAKGKVQLWCARRTGNGYSVRVRSRERNSYHSRPKPWAVHREVGR